MMKDPRKNNREKREIEETEAKKKKCSYFLSQKIIQRFVKNTEQSQTNMI